MSRPQASLTPSFFVAVLSLASGASSVRAQQPNACKSSYEAAQELRADRKLALALRELDLCINACPRILGSDCQAWKDEISPLLGTGAITLSSPDGERTFSARIDGEPITLRTGQSMVRLDPGDHVIEIAEAGFVEVKRSVTARAGAVTEINIALERAAPSSTPGFPLPVEEESLPVFPFVLGGVGAAALTAGLVLGIHGQVKAADLRDSCAKDGPFCPRRRVDAIETEWQVGAVLAGAGAAMLGVAVILYAVDAPVQANASGIAIRF